MNKPFLKMLTYAVLPLALTPVAKAVTTASSPALLSFETGHTISQVRTANGKNGEYILANSYEGKLLAIDYSGNIIWQNPLGNDQIMNRDIWAGDLNSDGKDEIFAASGNGTLYALSDEGQILWTFKQNDVPLNAVATFKKNGETYVAVGGYDKNLYYLSSAGVLLKTISSSAYSKEKSWGNDGIVPPKFEHIANFIRPVKQDALNDNIVVHGTLHSMSTSGHLYEFAPLADLPFRTTAASGSVKGDLKITDRDKDGSVEYILGTTSVIQNSNFSVIQPEKAEPEVIFNINDLAKKIDRFGYRVSQTEVINEGENYQYLTLFGSKILITPADLNSENTEILSNSYSYNDMWKSADSNRIILASAQSGGSAVHVINLQNNDWKSAYENLAPPGNISKIIENTAKVKAQLSKFSKPAYQGEQTKVYMMSEDRDGVENLIENYNQVNKSPVFLNYVFTGAVENFDRSGFENEVMRDKRDKRKKYTLTQQQSLDLFVPAYENELGLATWGGHGNDPYFFSLDTKKKIIDAANGKKTVLIFPELEGHDENFAWMMQDHIIPLADYARGKNTNIYVRTKHTFWQSTAHSPMWEELMSGEYADIFIPAMEETTDKSMELSLAARTGTWLGGATDSWGDRVARDNTSFDRLRQHSHQMLPNGYLRKMINSISNGATYINNFSIDQEYMSILWELIAKGALYVPKKDELLHISPVHLSMTEPDEHFLNESNNVKWLTFYDEAVENSHKMVFSRLNGTWPGAKNTEWDFSTYAAGVKDRRLNVLPPYSNGLVLLTPLQNGHCPEDLPRGNLEDNLHPSYKNNMTQFITDGRYYYSSDFTKKYTAEEYYKIVEAEIKAQSKKLPLKVEGDVAWTLAQVSPTHLRLTLIDGGFINPSDKIAKVKFQTAKPKAVKDILSGQVFTATANSQIEVEIPTGMFRFIDIELEQEIK